jgi:hypothetical protein
VGRHHEEGVEVKEISIVDETDTGVGADAGLHPTRKDDRRKIVRKFLCHMMFELRQVILMLREHLIGHLANLGEG